MSNGDRIKPFPQGPRLVNEIDTYIRQVNVFINEHKTSTDPLVQSGLSELTATLNDLQEMIDEVRDQVMDDRNTTEIRSHFQEFKAPMDEFMQVISERDST